MFLCASSKSAFGCSFVKAGRATLVSKFESAVCRGDPHEESSAAKITAPKTRIDKCPKVFFMSTLYALPRAKEKSPTPGITRTPKRLLIKATLLRVGCMPLSHEFLVVARILSCCVADTETKSSRYASGHSLEDPEAAGEKMCDLPCLVSAKRNLPAAIFAN